MSKEFTKSYAINRIAELNEQIVEMTDNQNQTMRYLNRIRDENNQLKQQLAEKDKEIERLKVFEKAYYFNQTQVSQESMDLLLQNAYQVHNETQLAIQELEKVKNKCNGMYELWLDSNYKENMYNNEDIAGVFEDISVFTNDLIKKLKGE